MLFAAGVGTAAPLRTAPELERPTGIEVAPRAEREELATEVEARDALRRFEEEVRDRWEEIRELDLTRLSRTHVEETEGYRLPADPGDLEGRVLARDAEGRFHLEIRGPRLPARYDIVHRHLYLYAVWDPTGGELRAITVTIGGWILE